MLKCPFFILIGTAVTIAGCSKGTSIATYPVTGKVTYQGKPVVGANVSYLTSNPDDPRAGGFTDSDGQFSLTTYVGPQQVLKGAPAGDFQVVITKEEAKAGQQEGMGVDPANADPQKFQQMMEKMWQAQSRKADDKEQANPKSEIPVKYGKRDTTPLKTTVVTGVNDPVEFKLTDD